MAAPDNWIWDTSPDCITHGVQPGLPFGLDSDGGQYVFQPFLSCLEEGGFFTFGPGKVYAGATGHPAELADIGNVLTDPSSGLITLTVLGILVMILAFVAFVWTEHRKLMDRAGKLRGAAAPRPAPPMAPGEGGGSGG